MRRGASRNIVRRGGGEALPYLGEGQGRGFGEARRAEGEGKAGAARQVRLARERFQALRRQNARGWGRAEAEGYGWSFVPDEQAVQLWISGPGKVLQLST